MDVKVSKDQIEAGLKSLYGENYAAFGGWNQGVRDAIAKAYARMRALELSALVVNDAMIDRAIAGKCGQVDCITRDCLRQVLKAAIAPCVETTFSERVVACCPVCKQPWGSVAAQHVCSSPELFRRENGFPLVYVSEQRVLAHRRSAGWAEALCWEGRKPQYKRAKDHYFEDARGYLKRRATDQ